MESLIQASIKNKIKFQVKGRKWVAG